MPGLFCLNHTVISVLGVASQTALAVAVLAYKSASTHNLGQVFLVSQTVCCALRSHPSAVTGQGEALCSKAGSEWNRRSHSHQSCLVLLNQTLVHLTIWCSLFGLVGVNYTTAFWATWKSGNVGDRRNSYVCSQQVVSCGVMTNIYAFSLIKLSFLQYVPASIHPSILFL